MRQDTGKVFDELAGNYAKFRPHWSSSIMAEVAGVASSHECALEAGCGSGQATELLATHFARVIATDPAPQAIGNAPSIDNVTWAVSSCDDTPADDGSVDLIFAGQAAHWFDMEAFAGECRRVGRPDAHVLVLTYDLVGVDEGAIDAVIGSFYRRVRGDWDERRAIVDSQYRDLAFPFREETPPTFDPIVERWTAQGMLGYIRTWSGVRNCTRRIGADPVADIEQDLIGLWGPEPRDVSFPIFSRLGAVH